ncbi:Protein N-acetyltransferase, RimJ/RimL family [Nocardioides scoriae]|uniref:Protein N-acetyltransferase, RimJ/RimL family n=1 Tax=Nocardioides scoriae TaxID=642780 RepID=A0A1H1RD78_9ACTN|nr:GNAT family N-acetyltransferase [Nocardioides scoriae]SDS33670.1 Protein N-acetyltransferase, RimJ/RimL family [Nocardioides scoriae]
MNLVPTLSDGVVTLRGHRGDDVPGVLEQCQDPETQRWTTVPVPYTEEDAETFVHHLVPSGWESGRAWGFAMTAADETGAERFAGSLDLVDRGDGLVEIGYGTSPWARRRGLTERAARLLLEWGFAEQGVEVVQWVAGRGNWASRRLAWRLGFDVGRDAAVVHQRGRLLPAWAGTLRRGEPLAPRHPWYDVPVLHGERVVLRPLAEADLPRMLECLQDEQMRHFSEGPRERAPHTVERWPDLVDERREWAARGEALAWTVADPQHDTHLGLVQLHRVHHRRQAELGFWAHPDSRGRGLTTEAVRLVVRHALVPWDDGGLGLRRVHAFAAAANTASRGVLAGAGLTETGRTRQEVLLGDGTWSDGTLHDVLGDDWVDPRADDAPR